MAEDDELGIRPATPQDFDIWFALYDEVAAEGRWIGGEHPTDREMRRQNFERYLGSDEAVMLLGEVRGELVGNVGVELRRGVAEFGMLVEASWRGRGVGSKLLQACIDWAREHGAHKVSLEVWPNNHAAIALYRKFGFEQEAVRRRHYRRRNGELWDALIMGLILDWDSPASPYGS